MFHNQQHSNFNPKAVLNFNTTIQLVPGRIGWNTKDMLPADILLKYESEKPGGSDVGHVVSVPNDRSRIVKTGVSLSLLGQALSKYVKGIKAEADGDNDTANDCFKKEKLYIHTFILGNFTRITGTKPKDHPQILQFLQTNNSEFKAKFDNAETDKEKSSIFMSEVKTIMDASFDQFKTTEKGQALIQKLQANENLTSHDIYAIYLDLAGQNVVMKNVLGLAAFADVTSGAFGQYFSNQYQSQQLAGEHLDAHKLLIESGKEPAIFMSSAVIKSVPFDKFLIDAYKSGQLKEQISKLNGLSAAILIRHLMGESGDLGPDNMLVVEDKNGNLQVVNVDVTGFRYARRNEFARKDREGNIVSVSLGWEATLLSYDEETLANKLYDGSVFNSRFAKDAKLEKDAVAEIVTTLKEHAQATIVDDVNSVVNWLGGLDAERSIVSMVEATENVYKNLNPAVQPSQHYVGKLLDHQKQFVSEAIVVATQAIENRPQVESVAAMQM